MTAAVCHTGHLCVILNAKFRSIVKINQNNRCHCQFYTLSLLHFRVIVCVCVCVCVWRESSCLLVADVFVELLTRKEVFALVVVCNIQKADILSKDFI